MKIFIAFAALIAGISAGFPGLNKIDLRNERLVTDSIASAIQDLSQSIKDAGLDPLYINSVAGVTQLPVPVIFSAEGVIEEFLFTGLSNIVINNLNYALLTSRLTFDIVLPNIQFSLNKAETEVTFFGKQYTASTSGSLAISSVRVAGNVRVSIGLITGISIRSVTINFTLGGIQSALNVMVQSWDLSTPLNTFLGITIPTTLNEFSSEINELLEILVEEIAGQIL